MPMKTVGLVLDVGDEIAMRQRGRVMDTGDLFHEYPTI
jgi:hypothetical protein